MTQQKFPSYTLDDICNAAIAKHNLRGYNHLGKLLDIAGSSISQWRTGRTWPADSTIIELAALAGYDPSEALINLRIWKNEDNPEVTKHYSRIGEALKRASAVIIMAFAVFATSAHEINAKSSVVANKNGTQLHGNAHKYTLCDICMLRIGLAVADIPISPRLAPRIATV